MAETFVQQITILDEEREQRREERRIQTSLSPQRGPRLSNLSLERFRTTTKYHDRPAAADIAFRVAAYANGVAEDRIEHALEDDRLTIPRSQPFQKSCLHPENYGEGQEMGLAISISASSPVVVLPCCIAINSSSF
jgi:hypothetical protein